MKHIYIEGGCTSAAQTALSHESRFHSQIKDDRRKDFEIITLPPFPQNFSTSFVGPIIVFFHAFQNLLTLPYQYQLHYVVDSWVERKFERKKRYNTNIYFRVWDFCYGSNFIFFVIVFVTAEIVLNKYLIKRTMHDFGKTLKCIFIFIFICF